MNGKIAFVASGVVLISACTGPVNEQTVRDMPTGYMCRILDSSEYMSLPSEQRAIYAELERRGEDCVDGTQRIIIRSE
jgi:hypothetical protein